MTKTALALTLAFLCILTLMAGNVQLAEAITINGDGSITGTDKIRRDGNVYTLTDNVIYTIRVGKSNIVIDGAGYTLEGNEIEGNGAGVLLLPGVNKVTIKNLRINNFITGIYVKDSGNVVTGCAITDCYTGISLNEASDNTISGNDLIDTNAGVRIEHSSNNTLRDNRLENSTLSFGTDGWFNSIDSSNTIDGKPVYYLVNKKDLIISPSDYPRIGYLALVNCTNMTVKDLKLSDAKAYGIIMVYTTNSTIIHNSLTNNWHGLHIRESYGNNITENYVANNKEFGISVSSTVANTITRNNIENNQVGIYLGGSGQIIYHNNFINNSLHVDSADWHPLNRMPLPYGMHVWDNGYPSGGNFWSGYDTTDINNDGIVDVGYVINQPRNNTDRYPLTNPVSGIPEFPEDENSPAKDSQPFPIMPVVLASVTVVVVLGAGLLVYFKKYRRQCDSNDLSGDRVSVSSMAEKSMLL